MWRRWVRTFGAALLLNALLTSGGGSVAEAAPPRPVDPKDTTQIDSRPCSIALCEIYYSRAYVHDVLGPLTVPGAAGYAGAVASLCGGLGPGAPVCGLAGAAQIGQGWSQIVAADEQNQCAILKTELISPLQASWVSRTDGPICDALDR